MGPEGWEMWTQKLSQDMMSAPNMSTAVQTMNDRTREWLSHGSHKEPRPMNLSLSKDEQWTKGVAHGPAIRLIRD